MIENGERGRTLPGADVEAMRRLQAGEKTALSEIMDRWRSPILSFLYRLVGNYEDASDLAQEVFVRLYRSRHRYSPTGNFSSFLFTIASNLAKNQLRWRSRHPEAALEPELDSPSELEASDASPYLQLEQSERGRVVKAAVQRLPEKLQLPVILFHFQDLSHTEIGEILHCSPKTVETRLYRGRKLLKGWLNGSGLA